MYFLAGLLHLLHSTTFSSSANQEGEHHDDSNNHNHCLIIQEELGTAKVNKTRPYWAKTMYPFAPENRSNNGDRSNNETVKRQTSIGMMGVY